MQALPPKAGRRRIQEANKPKRGKFGRTFSGSDVVCLMCLDESSGRKNQGIKVGGSRESVGVQSSGLLNGTCDRPNRKEELLE